MSSLGNNCMLQPHFTSGRLFSSSTHIVALYRFTSSVYFEEAFIELLSAVSEVSVLNFLTIPVLRERRESLRLFPTRGNKPDFKGFVVDDDDDDVVVVVVVVVVVALVLLIFDKLSGDKPAESIIFLFDVDVTAVVVFLILEFTPSSAEILAESVFICSSIRFLNISRKLPSFAN